MRRSKRSFSLLALLFFLFSGFSWADVPLTEQEYQTLLTKLDRSETALMEALSLLGLSPEELESLRTLDERVGKLLTQSKAHEDDLNLLLEKSETHEESLEKLRSGVSLEINAGAFYDFDQPGIYGGVSFQF